LLFKRALAIIEQATSLNNLAEIYRAQGKYDDAEQLFKRALAIQEKAFGPDHPDTHAVSDNLHAMQAERVEKAGAK
jgi:tetratricopeptide (TPR) repeat protein